MIDAADIRDIIASQLKIDPTGIVLGDKVYRIVADGLEERRRLLLSVQIPGWFGSVLLELRDLEVKNFFTYPDGTDLSRMREWVYALE